MLSSEKVQGCFSKCFWDACFCLSTLLLSGKMYYAIVGHILNMVLDFSVNQDDDGPIVNAKVNPLFSVTMMLKKKMNQNNCQSSQATHRAKLHWKSALKGMAEREDPWANLVWDNIAIETATRHSYNPLSKKWTKEKVVIKMEQESFGKGAMRECFRMWDIFWFTIFTRGVFLFVTNFINQAKQNRSFMLVLCGLA